MACKLALWTALFESIDCIEREATQHKLRFRDGIVYKEMHPEVYEQEGPIMEYMNHCTASSGEIMAMVQSGNIDKLKVQHTKNMAIWGSNEQFVQHMNHFMAVRLPLPRNATLVPYWKPWMAVSGVSHH
jgi:hypothetical protein